MLEALLGFLNSTGFAAFSWGNLVMILVGCLFVYLGLVRRYEPLLLIPMGFGMILANIPYAALGSYQEGGLLYYFYWPVKEKIIPPLIFLGIGAMADFGPLIANPKTFFLGAGAQLGIFTAIFLALALGFGITDAGSIGIIGGADGPTAIYVTTILSPELLGPIALAAYSYMALVPLIQPPIIRLMTTKKERGIVMEELRTVSRLERIVFPIMITIVISLLLPKVAPLIGMLMLGNLLRESGVTERLAKTAANEIINVATIFLAVSVGATMVAENFLNLRTLEIFLLGIVAFVVGTAGGVLVGKLLCWLTRGQVNPIIGAAGVSAVPMAARVAQAVGQKENPNNYLLYHAMGPNVAGVIASATCAGILISMLG